MSEFKCLLFRSSRNSSRSLNSALHFVSTPVITLVNIACTMQCIVSLSVHNNYLALSARLLYFCHCSICKWPLLHSLMHMQHGPVHIKLSSRPHTCHCTLTCRCLSCIPKHYSQTDVVRKLVVDIQAIAVTHTRRCKKNQNIDAFVFS